MRLSGDEEEIGEGGVVGGGEIEMEGKLAGFLGDPVFTSRGIVRGKSNDDLSFWGDVFIGNS